MNKDLVEFYEEEKKIEKEITVNFCRETENYRKKYLNAVADYEMVMSELQELKKQLETLEKSNIQLISKLDKYDAIVDERDELKKQLEENKNQQKEFIEYLEKTIEELECGDAWDRYKVLVVNKILSKYKEIIGENK